MLIVVLDDDDDLVTGKSRDNNNSMSNSWHQQQKYQNTSHNATSHNRRQQQQQGSHSNRASPAKHGKSNRDSDRGDRKKPHRDQRDQRDRNQRDQRQNYNNHQYQQSQTRGQRPQINTQKLAQRLNNIKQDQDRQHSRGRSPRKDRTTPDKSPYDSMNTSMHSSHSEPSMSNSYTMDKPHAVIVKPVERRKKKRRVRPDPEGAPIHPTEMDELDKIMSSTDPIFSDYGTDEESETESPKRPPRERKAPSFAIAAFSIGLGLNSNTMIKYTIIGTELQNIIRVSLRMVRIFKFSVYRS